MATFRVAGFFDADPVSRGQAKRMMAHAPLAGTVVLDFAGIATIGPMFADELFRVIRRRRPGLELQPINMAPEVERAVLGVWAG